MRSLAILVLFALLLLLVSLDFSGFGLEGWYGTLV